MSAERHCILLFASIHDVMAAERALVRAGIWCDMAPTPRQLSSDCGMALRVRPADLGAAEEEVEKSKALCTGVFIREDQGYSPA
jgi:hypothetical protein